MVVFRCKIDQAIAIGTAIVVSPTDIDSRHARLVAQGRMLGGPEDGASFRSVHELSVGQSFALGPVVRIALLAIEADVAKIGVTHPPSLVVSAEDVSRPAPRKRDVDDDQEFGLDD